MFGNNYYFGFMRRFVTVFGTLFNDITITRPHGADEVQSYKVPITYSSQDKMLARLYENPELNRKVAAVTPAMSFEVLNPRYDASRNLQSTLKRCKTTSDGIITQFVGAPYNIDFKLYIYSDQEEDGLRVLENILPYFRPSLTVTVKMVPEMEYNLDIPITLNSVDVDNQSWDAYKDRRKIIWTLSFTMKAEFLGPIKTPSQGNVPIRVVKINLYDSLTANTFAEEVRVQPGLTANGEPTTDISLTIPVNDIDATDDFGYIVQILRPDEI
jgi:hypothetical protein